MQLLTLGLALLALAIGSGAQAADDPPTGEKQKDATNLPNPDPSPACDPDEFHGKGHYSDIRYGYAFVIVKPVHGVSKGKQWRIKLRPKKGFEHAKVTIEGKDRDAAWINKVARASVDSEIVICVPEDLIVGFQYEYLVTVANVGTIDPRVKVEK